LRAEQVGALAAIGLGPAHALAQRLRMHAQVGCDLGDRTLRLEHEPNAAVHQLLWVLPSSWHRRRISSPQDSKSWLRGLRQTRPGSEWWETWEEHVIEVEESVDLGHGVV